MLRAGAGAPDGGSPADAPVAADAALPLLPAHAEAVEVVAARSAALVAAVRAGNADAVDQLLRAGGLDVNAVCVDTTMLIMASAAGHVKIVEALIAAGADIDAKYGGTNPLIIASFGGHLEVVSALLKLGAFSGPTGAGGMTALRCARGKHGAHQDLAVEALLMRYNAQEHADIDDDSDYGDGSDSSSEGPNDSYYSDGLEAEPREDDHEEPDYEYFSDGPELDSGEDVRDSDDVI